MDTDPNLAVIFDKDHPEWNTKQDSGQKQCTIQGIGCHFGHIPCLNNLLQSRLFKGTIPFKVTTTKRQMEGYVILNYITFGNNMSMYSNVQLWEILVNMDVALFTERQCIPASQDTKVRVDICKGETADKLLNRNTCLYGLLWRRRVDFKREQERDPRCSFKRITASMSMLTHYCRRCITKDIWTPACS
jgi:hypothetical protein